MKRSRRTTETLRCRVNVALPAAVTMVMTVMLLGIACQGDMALTTGSNNGNNAVTGPGASCADPLLCCSEAEQTCWGNIDQGAVCRCNNLWDCSSNPGKCVQYSQVPGSGSWSCSWTDARYSCSSAGEQQSPPPGASNGWNCRYESGQWICDNAFPPNPSNGPGGVAQWTCLVSGDKTQCTAKPGTAPTLPPNTPPTGGSEINCADGIDNDGDGAIDAVDSDCPGGTIPTPNGVTAPDGEICDGKDNDGDGKVDEGNVCLGVQEPCPPGAYQICDCYCGVHRKCQPNGTWGPCFVDGEGAAPVPGGGCKIAPITSHAQCGFGSVCDYGECIPDFDMVSSQCKTHTDCPVGQVCDLGECQVEQYVANKCQ